MKNLLFIFLGLLLGSFIFSSCQIEKRVHRPGYHVQYKKSKPSKSAQIDRSRASKQAKEPQMHAFVESDELSASATEEMPVIKEDTKIVGEKSKSITSNSEVLIFDFEVDDNDCETLVYTNGVEALVKIEEITPVYIKYTRCDLQNGPLISVKRTDVHKIIYSNGVEDIITEEGTKRPNTNAESADAKLEVFGLISFIAGILGFLVAGIILGPTAIIFGIVSVALSSSEQREYKGKAFGVIGLLLGVLVTMIMILYFSTL